MLQYNTWQILSTLVKREDKWTRTLVYFIGYHDHHQGVQERLYIAYSYQMGT